jgi:autotransporter-associated beta strand protein
MVRSNWLLWLKSRTPTSSCTNRRPRFRPFLEALETRAVPAVALNATQLNGLDTNSGDNGGFIEPPDPIAAAGPNYVVEIVNSTLLFYNRQTHATTVQTLDGFFSPLYPGTSAGLFSDVYVTYDEMAGRWFISTMDVDFINVQSFFDFAVSDNSDPLSFSEMHKIETDEIAAHTLEQSFTDFPRVGWNANAYVVSFNMFGFYTEYPYNAQILTIDKNSVLDKNSSTVTSYQVDRPLPNSTMVPATMHGATATDPMWFVEEKGVEQDGTYQYLRVVKMTNYLSASPTFTDYYVKVTPYTISPFPEDPLAQITTAIDTRILSLDWRKATGHMVACQNVGLDADNNVHARWYLLSTAGTAPALMDEGDTNPGGGADTYMPSAALTDADTIGMTYLESSLSENMSMYVTGRSASDAAGTMETPKLAVAGAESYNGTRAGDFSGCQLDPITGTSFWACNEYAISGLDPSIPNWGTWISNFSITVSIDTWTGAGLTSNWSDPNNWSGNVAPSPGDILLFPAFASQFTATNDFAAGTRFTAITLSGGGYSISGNAICLATSLNDSNATGSNTVNLAITLKGAATFTAASNPADDLVLGGLINNGGFLLTLAGSGGPMELTNVISGNGGLTDASAGTVTLSGAGNTYRGATTVSAGTLLLQKSSGNAIPAALSDGATVRLAASNQIADAAAVTVSSGGLLDLNNNSDAIGALTLNSATVSTGTGTLTLGSNLVDSGASSINGNLALGTATRTITVNNTGDSLTINAIINGGVGLIKAGYGQLLLSAANSYSGTTTLSRGILAVANTNALGTGTFIAAGGTLSGSGATGITLPNAITLAGNLILGGSTDLTFNGTTTLTGSRTLTMSSTGLTTFAASIGQSGGSFSLTEGGTGRLVLLGGDTFSGGMVLSAGTLILGNSSALGNGTATLKGGTLAGNGAALIFGNALTLGGNFTFGGTSNLTFMGPATLTGSRTVTVSNTGLTTLGGAIGQSIAGLGLIKAGAGTLVLSGTNTYTGGTTVSAGTLLVNGSQTGSAVTVKSGATLGGSGTTGAVTVQSGGTLLPGSSGQTAILATGNLTLSSGSTYSALLGGPNPGASGYSQVAVNGTVTLTGSTLSLAVAPTFTPTISESFILISNDGVDPVVGTFTGLIQNATFMVGGMTFQINYQGGDGNDVVVTRIA